MMEYKLSIIVPLFNAELYIQRLKMSLSAFFNDGQNQIIFIDDGSTDEGAEQIKSMIQKESIENALLLINSENKGPSFSRNRGLKHAKGEYIAFLDADDAWHPDKVEAQMKMMKEQNALICGTAHKVVDERFYLEDCKINKKKSKYHSIGWPFVLFKSPFATPSVVIHNSLKSYYFDESMKYAEDYNLWIRIIHKHKALKIEEPLTYTFKHDYLSEQGSLSSNMWLMQKGNVDNYLMLVKNREFNFFDKMCIILGFLFAWVKFAKRVALKIIHKPFMEKETV